MSVQLEKDRKERIFGLMNGWYELEGTFIPESSMVENEFADGKPCAALYQEVFNANRRLCDRLGVDEDKDIEHLINNMQDIAKILAMKMFDYGMQVQQEATVSDRRENE
jgi:hypothetical protein